MGFWSALSALAPVAPALADARTLNTRQQQEKQQFAQDSALREAQLTAQRLAAQAAPGQIKYQDLINQGLIETNQQKQLMDRLYASLLGGGSVLGAAGASAAATSAAADSGTGSTSTTPAATSSTAAASSPTANLPTSASPLSELTAKGYTLGFSSSGAPVLKPITYKLVALQGPNGTKAVGYTDEQGNIYNAQKQPDPTAQLWAPVTASQVPISAAEASSLNALFNPGLKTAGLPTNQFTAGMTRQEANEIRASANNSISQSLSNKRLGDQMANLGTWTIAEDGNGNTILYNSKTGQTRAAPTGLHKSGYYAKQIAPLEAAKLNINDYMTNGVFDGPGDLALQHEFFTATQPSTGFRMTKVQQDILQNSRSWLGSFQAKALHATTGQWFTNAQRKQIADAATAAISAKEKSLQGGNGAGASTKAGTGADAGSEVIVVTPQDMQSAGGGH